MSCFVGAVTRSNQRPFCPKCRRGKHLGPPRRARHLLPGCFDRKVFFWCIFHDEFRHKTYILLHVLINFDLKHHLPKSVLLGGLLGVIAVMYRDSSKSFWDVFHKNARKWHFLQHFFDFIGMCGLRWIDVFPHLSGFSGRNWRLKPNHTFIILHPLSSPQTCYVCWDFLEGDCTGFTPPHFSTTWTIFFAL